MCVCERASLFNQGVSLHVVIPSLSGERKKRLKSETKSKETGGERERWKMDSESDWKSETEGMKERERER